MCASDKRAEVLECSTISYSIDKQPPTTMQTRGKKSWPFAVMCINIERIVILRARMKKKHIDQNVLCVVDKRKSHYMIFYMWWYNKSGYKNYGWIATKMLLWMKLRTYMYTFRILIQLNPAMICKSKFIFLGIHFFLPLPLLLSLSLFFSFTTYKFHA